MEDDSVAELTILGVRGIGSVGRKDFGAITEDKIRLALASQGGKIK